MSKKNQIKIYQYAPNNGIYLGEDVAKLDPLDKKPMIPAYATQEAPPNVKNGEVAIRKEGKWLLVADYGGHKVFSPEGVERVLRTGEEIPEGYLEEKPEPVITWEDVRQKRNALLAISDWTQLGDNPLTESHKKEWATYRQKLRDITDDFEEPNRAKWPKEPAK